MQPPIRPTNQSSRANSGSMPPVGQPGARPSDNTGPFEDTGYAPELRASRSENLYRRDERFWQHVPDMEETMHGRPRQNGYFDHPEQFHQTRSHKPPRGRRGSHVMALVLGVALLLMLFAVLFASPLMAVEEIRVIGNSTISSESIIKSSKLTIGMNRFFINENQVMELVEGDCRLICELVHMPEWNTVEIRVREREIVAVIMYNGIYYYADNRGMLVEEYWRYEDIDLSEKILVRGLSVDGTTLGSIVALRNADQLGVYNEILVELKVMSTLYRIKELDMSNMDNIFLTTRDGYTVHLGSGTDIHRKLRAMILTLDALVSGGYGVGTVDVTTPVNPTFVPAEGT